MGLQVREKCCPLWARAAPLVYLALCLAAIRAVVLERSDVSIAGILICVGLVAVFVVPAVFTTRRARLAMTSDGLAIDGRLERIEDVRIERGARGAGLLHLVLRSGETRSFIVPAYDEAQQLVATLPAVNSPAAGALAA
ncbi:MAG TPA: hypothetical protein VM925_33715 [Labilithrix sp.]|jgi:hypothetical protein|nr:hypothetical protein [Labilithrix sp.]